MKKSVLFGVLIVAMLFGVVGLAGANTVTYTGPAAGTVTVTATVNPKIALTVTTPDAAQTVDFGLVDPEVTKTAAVDLTVKSNKAYNLTVGAPAGDVAALGFVNSLTSLTGEAKGTNNYTDNYSITPPYTTDPNPYSVTVQYSVAQQ